MRVAFAAFFAALSFSAVAGSECPSKEYAQLKDELANSGRPEMVRQYCNYVGRSPRLMNLSLLARKAGDRVKSNYYQLEGTGCNAEADKLKTLLKVTNDQLAEVCPKEYAELTEALEKSRQKGQRLDEEGDKLKRQIERLK